MIFQCRGFSLRLNTSHFQSAVVVIASSFPFSRFGSRENHRLVMRIPGIAQSVQGKVRHGLRHRSRWMSGLIALTAALKGLRANGCAPLV